MDDTKRLSRRKSAILNLLETTNQTLTCQQIHSEISRVYDVSKITVIRDLNDLASQKLVLVEGRGPATSYKATLQCDILHTVDIVDYFDRPADLRTLSQRKASDFLTLIGASLLLTKSEIAQIRTVNSGFNERMSRVNRAQYKQEIERFTIELAWKSSAIEGNTYSLLETEELIKRGHRSGHTEFETLMIMNHKRAIEYILKNTVNLQALSLADIIEIHQLLVYGLDIDTGIRNFEVKITGTKYIPPSNPQLLRELLQDSIAIMGSKEQIVEQALIISALIAYLQPFADGNKRTARLVGNAVLLANKHPALSYRSVSEIEYKKAVLLLDESQNFWYYKQLFLEQYYFASENYLI